MPFFAPASVSLSTVLVARTPVASAKMRAPSTNGTLPLILRSTPSTPSVSSAVASSPRQLSGGRLVSALSDICFRKRVFAVAWTAISSRSASARPVSPHSARKSKKMFAASRLFGSPRSIQFANDDFHSARLAHQRGFIAITPPLHSG